MSVASMVVAGACTAPPTPTPVPLETATDFHVETVFDGLDRPTTVAFTTAGRAFVAEKSGRIKAFSSVHDNTPLAVIDLSLDVYDHADRGLLGLTVDPLFETTRPYVYALYSHDPPLFGDNPNNLDSCNLGSDDGCPIKSELVRITVDRTTLRMIGTPRVLSDNWCQHFSGHSIGDVEIGPDGGLYASSGDGANFVNVDYGQIHGNDVTNPCNSPPTGLGVAPSVPTAAGGALRAQSPAVPHPGFTTVFSGSVIKVDPDTGAAWPTNPWVGDPDPQRAKVVGYGFRNPFRLVSRPGTNQLFVSEVGWHDDEEIDVIDTTTGPPGNFGWPCFEGNNPQPAYEAVGLDLCERLYDTPSLVTPPLFSYPRFPVIVEGDNCQSGGRSAAGAAFYQGGTYPARFDGGLFFSDYGLGCVWFFPLGPNGMPDFADGELVVRGFPAVDLTLGPGGDAFLTDHNEGRIVRLVYDENSPPVARITASATQGGVPLTVNFDGRSSSDPDAGDTLTFAWDLDGDGEYDDATTPTASTTYTTEGIRSVRLRVTDSHGKTATAAVTVEVGSLFPIPVINSPAANLVWSSGDSINFTGSATDAQDGVLAPAAFRWEATVHHCLSSNPGDCHVHPLTTWNGVTSGSFVAPDHPYPSFVRLKLTVTDSNGNAASVSRDLSPQTVQLQVLSNPPGAQIVVGEETVVAPAQVTLIRNSENTVLTAQNQTLGGIPHTFASWSDGGAPIHVIRPVVNGSLTATFTPTPQ